MPKKSICIILLVLFSFFGCGLKEGVVQKDPTGFLWFTGNTSSAVVYIDDLDPITLDESSSKEVHYEINPGKHNIIVKKSGVEVVNRNILLGNGITMEIKIP